jgi:hypothetical protein
MVHNLGVQLSILIKLFLLNIRHLSRVFLAWFDPIRPQDSIIAMPIGTWFVRRWSDGTADWGPFLLYVRKNRIFNRLNPIEIQLKSTVKGKSKWNRQSQTSRQHRQYWPNSFKPSNKPLDNIPTGTMVHWFDDLQRWRLPDSDRHYTVQKLAKVSMSKAWLS